MADQKLKITLTAIDKTRAAFGKVQAGLGMVKKSVFSLQTAISALAAGTGIKRFAEEIDKLAKTSTRLGLTAQELRSLQFAAGQSGVEAQQLNVGLERFSRNISEAADGIGIGKRAFDKLGLSVKDNAGQLIATDELLMQVSDALKDVESPADRVRIAMDLFGRSGAGLVNLLGGGADQVNVLRNEFNKFAGELTTKQARAVEAANDRFSRLFASISGGGQQVTAKILPFLSKSFLGFYAIVLDGAAKAVSGFRAFGNTILGIVNQLADQLGFEKFDELTFGMDFEKSMQNTIKGLFEAELGAEQAAAAFGELGNQTLKIDVAPVQELEKSASTLGNLAQPIRLAKNGLVEYARAAKDVRENMRSAALDGVERLADTLTDVAMRTTTVKDAFRSMASSIVRDLVRIGIQRQITGPLAAALFGGLQQAPAQASVPRIGGAQQTARAIGGPVQRGGTYMVGERGPEMFVPSRSGSIVPNNQMGGDGVTIVQNINLSTGVQQTVRAEVMNMMPQIGNAAKSAVLDARRRGGNFAAAF